MASTAPPAGDPRSALVRKLGVKPGHEVVLVGAPAGWSIDELPGDVHLARRDTRAARRRPARREADVVVAFFTERRALEADLPALGDAIVADGALWAAWPRRAGGHVSDITDNDVRAAALPLGLVDVKVAALDNDWSALKLVWRRERRGGVGLGVGPPARRGDAWAPPPQR